MPLAPDLAVTVDAGKPWKSKPQNTPFDGWTLKRRLPQPSSGGRTVYANPAVAERVTGSVDCGARRGRTARSSDDSPNRQAPSNGRWTGKQRFATEPFETPVNRRCWRWADTFDFPAMAITVLSL